MQIKNLFAEINIDCDIKSLETDSRIIAENSLFFCIKGLSVDSHDLIEEAIKNGAVAIVHEREFREEKLKYSEIIFIKTDDSKKLLAKTAQIFYKEPSKDMKIFAVTGTNGKTTTSYLIYKILSSLEKSSYNGTAGSFIGDISFDYSGLTTPNSIQLAEFFDKARKKSSSSLAFEVSSHALSQKRADYIDIDCAIYTNLTRDHLDYHKTMEEYKKAKLELFEQLKKEAIAVLNIDDEYYEDFKNAANCKCVSYGKSQNADFRFENEIIKPNYTEFDFVYKGKRRKIKTNLISEVNIYNLCASISAIISTGVDLDDIIECLENIDFKIGRLEYVEIEECIVIVDYAHTPDSFEKIFSFAKKSKNSDQRIISVFGSAGKRDKGKRPIMGEIADKYSDIIILTEEDNRDESPIDIAKEIAKGIKDKTKVLIEADRLKAIKLAKEKANKNDIVLILGKAREDFLYREKEVEWIGDTNAAKL